MPPKAKFTRQEIIDAAVDIARRAPLEAVTAQELASVLGTSTRPVFTYFRTLEEVRAAVVEEAGKIYGRYVERGLSMNPPFKGYGMETIRFAREEPNLFRLLFLRRRDTAEFPPTENHSADIRRAIRETFSLTDAQADELHRHLWIYVHGLCTLPRRCAPLRASNSSTRVKFSLPDIPCAPSRSSVSALSPISPTIPIFTTL